MTLIAGIDEAGFGPILGPLVVSGVAFRVPQERGNDCLWTTLGKSIARKPANRTKPIIVADSKQVYTSKIGLAGLERATLVMLGLTGRECGTLRTFLRSAAPDAPAALDEYDWYRGVDFALPVDPETGDLGTRRNAVRRTMESSGISFLGPVCQVLLEGHYNRLVRKTRNKSVALLTQVMRVISHILNASDEQDVRLFVDRLGGRTHYREPLMTAFPGCELAIDAEEDGRSAYRLVSPRRRIAIEFTTGGDNAHFPIALASMYSKYVRELCMRVFNAYWRQEQADLKPTAGYYTDAHRWLEEASPMLQRKAVDRAMLVRER